MWFILDEYSMGTSNTTTSTRQKLSGFAQNSILWMRLTRSKLRIIWGRLRGKRIVLVIGTPVHRNIGDLAIMRAELSFIHSFVPGYVVAEIPFELIVHSNRNILPGIVRPGDILMGHGGGNMGDMYPDEEICRQKFIQGFPNNRIVIFPQTIHFSDTSRGRQELATTRAAYARHKDLTLIAREKHSLQIMQKSFKANSVLFTPDIVLSLSRCKPGSTRNGLLICLRDDQEAKVDQDDKKTITSFAKRHFNTVRHTDTVSSASFFPYRSRSRIVEQKLDEFRAAELVITDRLHGMVFAAITGTPCIALANFNHKVVGTYEWIKHLPYIKFCDDISSLDSLLNEIDLSKNYTYDPDYFSKYWHVIQRAVTE